MLPFQNYYSPKDGFLYQSVSAMMDMDGGGGGGRGSSNTTSEKKSAVACKSHSEAERRRRERINGHLRILRTLLPNTTKRDKAYLLAEVLQVSCELHAFSFPIFIFSLKTPLHLLLKSIGLAMKLWVLRSGEEYDLCVEKISLALHCRSFMVRNGMPFSGCSSPFALDSPPTPPLQTFVVCAANLFIVCPSTPPHREPQGYLFHEI